MQHFFWDEFANLTIQPRIQGSFSDKTHVLGQNASEEFQAFLLLTNLKGALIVGLLNHSCIYFLVIWYLSNAYCVSATVLGTVNTKMNEAQSVTFSGEDRFKSKSHDAIFWVDYRDKKRMARETWLREAFNSAESPGKTQRRE